MKSVGLELLLTGGTLASGVHDVIGHSGIQITPPRNFETLMHSDSRPMK